MWSYFADHCHKYIMYQQNNYKLQLRSSFKNQEFRKTELYTLN
jgi:hypothetical protein